MDFYKAENRFRFLEEQRARGVLTMEQYRAELNQLRVTDQWGRLWMLQEQTGQWHVYHEGQWQAAQPPVQAPQQVPPQSQPRSAVQLQQPAQVRPQPQPVPQPQDSGVSCGKIALNFVLWGVLWGIVAVAVFLFVGDDRWLALGGVALAAFISLIFILLNLSSSWKGQVVDIRMERVRVDDGDDGWHWENVRYAFVRRSNGKTKKMRAMPQWQVGDRLEKRRGEGHIRHYPRQ